jgi:predicted dehydrogenase
VRIGILGFAHGHVDMYCSRWREQPALGVQVVAGWDHDAARLAAACGKHALATAPSAQALVARPDVDAVVIAAETSMHAELVEIAAAAGKPIALQKPLALTLAEADRIVAAVARHGVPFTLAWQMRVDPHNLQVKELLASGRFGRVWLTRRRHCLSTHLWKDFDLTWHVQPHLNRDIFADDAAHAIDFVYWLRGLPQSAVAETATLLNPRIPNDQGIALFRYADGSLAEVTCTFVAVAGETTLEIVCENGIIVGNYGDGVSCSTPRPPGGSQLRWYLKGDAQWTVSQLPDITNHGERLYGLCGPLADFFRGRRPPVATAEEGRDVLAMTLASLDAAAQGRRIAIP